MPPEFVIPPLDMREVSQSIVAEREASGKYERKGMG